MLQDGIDVVERRGAGGGGAGEYGRKIEKGVSVCGGGRTQKKT